MSARTCADCGHRLDIHTPDGCVALHLDGSLCACPTPTPARPEGETPPCQCGHALNQHLLAGGHCEQRGCACRLFVIPLPPARERGEATPAPASGETTYPCDDCGTMRTKAEGGTTFTVCDACWDRLCRKSPTPPSRERGEATPAPASGEEELAWLRIRDVRQPQSGKSRCCGTWELVEPALLIAVRERDWILEAFARLTRELAEARARLAALTHRDQAYNSPAGIPQPIKGYESLPESIGVAVMCFSDEAVRYGLSLEVGDGSSHIAGEFLRGAAKELYDTLEREFDAARALAAAKGGA